MSHKIEVIDWVKSGAPLREGIRLFGLLRGESHPFLKLLDADPNHCLPILKAELARATAVNLSEHDPKGNFRDNWPFLNQSDCPSELKILAADKISAYWRYIQSHAILFDCTTKAEQQSTMHTLMRNYLENRAIIAEFVYYKEHGHILGTHPIFKWTKELERLRKLKPIELVTYQHKLEHNIWRIEAELKTGKKPHLQTEREQRLTQKKLQLAEINRMIAALLK